MWSVWKPLVLQRRSVSLCTTAVKEAVRVCALIFLELAIFSPDFFQIFPDFFQFFSGFFRRATSKASALTRSVTFKEGPGEGGTTPYMGISKLGN